MLILCPEEGTVPACPYQTAKIDYFVINELVNAAFIEHSIKNPSLFQACFEFQIFFWLIQQSKLIRKQLMKGQTAKSIIQKMFQQPVQRLLLSRKPLPNIQVLRLYRSVYKFGGKFYWNNDKGQPWKQVIRRSARKQFDLSRNQKDPFLIMKMMVTTRQCMAQMDQKICKAQFQLIKNVDQTRNQSFK